MYIYSSVMPLHSVTITHLYFMTKYCILRKVAFVLKLQNDLQCKGVLLGIFMTLPVYVHMCSVCDPVHMFA